MARAEAGTAPFKKESTPGPPFHGLTAAAMQQNTIRLMNRDIWACYDSKRALLGVCCVGPIRDLIGQTDPWLCPK